MCVEITKGFDQNFIYITYVEKIDKSKMNMLFEDYKVIGKVRFYIYDKKNKKWIQLCWDRRKFAKYLLVSKIGCYHGEIRYEDGRYYLCKIIEVRAFERNGDYWIETNPDNTKVNNLIKK